MASETPLNDARHALGFEYELWESLAVAYRGQTLSADELCAIVDAPDPAYKAKAVLARVALRLGRTQVPELIRVISPDRLGQVPAQLGDVAQVASNAKLYVCTGQSMHGPSWRDLHAEVPDG